MSEPICCEWCAGNESGWRSALEAVAEQLEFLGPEDHKVPTYGQAIQDVKDIIEKLRGEA